MTQPLVYGHSEVARFAEPNPEELAQMIRDGMGRRNVIRFLAEFYLNNKPGAVNLANSYNPMGNWSKP